MWSSQMRLSAVRKIIGIRLLFPWWYTWCKTLPWLRCVSAIVEEAEWGKEVGCCRVCMPRSVILIYGSFGWFGCDILCSAFIPKLDGWSFGYEYTKESDPDNLRIIVDKSLKYRPLALLAECPYKDTGKIPVFNTNQRKLEKVEKLFDFCAKVRLLQLYRQQHDTLQTSSILEWQRWQMSLAKGKYKLVEVLYSRNILFSRICAIRNAGKVKEVFIYSTSKEANLKSMHIVS